MAAEDGLGGDQTDYINYNSEDNQRNGDTAVKVEHVEENADYDADEGNTGNKQTHGLHLEVVFLLFLPLGNLGDDESDYADNADNNRGQVAGGVLAQNVGQVALADGFEDVVVWLDGLIYA